jgi:hypothetical protein
MQPDSLSLLGNLESALPPDLLVKAVFVVAGIVVLAYGVVSAILVYHWRRYSESEKSNRVALQLYFSTSGAFILLMAVSLIAYFISL